ncbi:carotenoid cleavage dioxygenase [Azospirillum lipoferum]|uniref:Dioxygenase n=1 Tax=Azospirillum lipoferum TaxID=193 RepID=A0A5A9G7B5_AZOLI|nr:MULTISPECIES: carotenoid oxygenase family protein [Azospirillum]KAA0590247.1 carotenoid oxygenase family protein [Azospirillum lipoferum]MCP1615000.1 carotenoid cleavage dioxygenase [Azospirillum lipoferum]MDW5532455.1 carotenoid oxygenase family protein [Azospirillum sp. NL1]
MTVAHAAEDGLRFPDSLVFRGYAAPVRIEGDVYDLEVIGRIPEGLNGAYVRASADHAYPPLHGKDIFLNGDGMIHLLRFENGHADLKTRYVQTEKLKRERAARRALFGHYRNPFTDDPSVAGVDSNTANTSVLWHGGRLFALKEAALPMQLDPRTLETLGPWNFNGKLTGRTFTAHPKIDPKTGELIAFSYNTSGQASKEIDLHWISPDGELVRQETFEAPYPSMVHDCLVSPNYIAFTICPMLCDWERVKRGEPYFVWDPSLPVMVAVIPRKEGVKGIRWFRSPIIGMETHTINAWEDGSVLHLDHFFTRSGWLSQFPHASDPDAHELPPFAERWSVDLASADDSVSIERLNEQVGEMPVIDPRYLGQKTRRFFFGTANPALGPMLDWGPKGPPFTCLCRADLETGELDYYYAGPDSSPEEPLFVPKSADAPENDGWLICVVGRRAENRTDVVILDACDLAAGPVATIRLPCRIHEGFHGTWLPPQAVGL